jgi:hypothetical protein
MDYRLSWFFYERLPLFLNIGTFVSYSEVFKLEDHVRSKYHKICRLKNRIAEAHNFIRSPNYHSLNYVFIVDIADAKVDIEKLCGITRLDFTVVRTTGSIDIPELGETFACQLEFSHMYQYKLNDERRQALLQVVRDKLHSLLGEVSKLYQ